MTLRPAVEPPNRTFVIGAMIGGGALVASIAAALIMRMPVDPPPVAPIAKVTVTPSAPVVVPVPVTITPPAPPPPPPPPLAVELDPPSIRATSPHVYADCVLQSENTPCAWDHGFPAISADGQTIVREHHFDDGGRGNPSLAIQFVDVATSKVTKQVTILTPDEADLGDEMRPKIAQRVAKATKLIEAGEYRSLVPLSHLEDHLGTKLRIEVAGGFLRLVDPETHTELYRADFNVAHTHNPDAECGGYSPADNMVVWWDAETRTLAADVYYQYGGCMCGGETVAHVKRLR